MTDFGDPMLLERSAALRRRFSVPGRKVEETSHDELSSPDYLQSATSTVFLIEKRGLLSAPTTESRIWQIVREPVALEAAPQDRHADVFAGSYMLRTRLMSATQGDVDEFSTATESASSIGADETIHVAHELTKAIVALDAAYYEDYERQLRPDSVRALECFMHYSNADMPLLGAESAGSIIATWEKGQECLALRFKTRYHLEYAVTYLKDGELRRKWGRSHLGSVLGECPEARRLVSA